MAEPLEAALAMLQERGAPARDPVRWLTLAALARRAAAMPDGAARRLLEARTQQQVQRWQAECPAPGEPADAAAAAPAPTEAAPSPLSQLLAELARAQAEPDPGGQPGGSPAAGPGPAATASPGGSRTPAAPAELKALRQFRQSWSRLNTEQRLARALAEAPRNAGPLNPQALVARVLATLDEQSPAYLHHFLAQVDALIWLEAASGDGALPLHAGLGKADAARRPRTP